MARIQSFLFNGSINEGVVEIYMKNSFSILLIIMLLLLCCSKVVALPSDVSTTEILTKAKKALDSKEWVSAATTLRELTTLTASLKNRELWHRFRSEYKADLNELIQHLWKEYERVTVSSALIKDIAALTGNANEFVALKDSYQYLQSRNLWNKLYITVDGDSEVDVAILLNEMFRADDSFSMLYADTVAIDVIGNAYVKDNAIHAYKVQLKDKPIAEGSSFDPSEVGLPRPSKFSVEIRRIDKTANAIGTTWDSGVEFTVDVPYSPELLRRARNLQSFDDGVEIRYQYGKQKLEALRKAFKKHLPTINRPDAFTLINTEGRLDFAEARAFLALSRDTLLKRLAEMRGLNNADLNADITRFYLVHELPVHDPSDYSALLKHEDSLFTQIMARRIETANDYLVFYAVNSRVDLTSTTWRKFSALIAEDWNRELGLRLLSHAGEVQDKRLGSLWAMTLKNLAAPNQAVLEKLFVGNAASEPLQNELIRNRPILYLDLMISQWNTLPDLEQQTIAAKLKNIVLLQVPHDRFESLISIIDKLDSKETLNSPRSLDKFRNVIAFIIRVSQQVSQDEFITLYKRALLVDKAFLTNHPLRKFRPVLYEFDSLGPSAHAVRQLLQRSDQYLDFSTTLFDLADGDDELLILSMIHALRNRSKQMDIRGVGLLCDKVLQMVNKSELLEIHFVSFVGYCKKNRVLDKKRSDDYLQKLLLRSNFETTKWEIAKIVDLSTYLSWMSIQ